MAAPKGNKFAKGREKGSKNVRTVQWAQLGEAIAGEHTERFNAILQNCDDETFLRNYGMVLEYFQPKLARTEVSQDGDQTMTIRVIESGD